MQEKSRNHDSLPLPRGFRTRIAAETEPIAARFVCSLIDANSSNEPIKPLLLARERCEGYPHFEPITSWSWADAAAQVSRIAAEGFNILVISEEMHEWITTREAINEELAAFEAALAEHNISAFAIEPFSPKEMLRLKTHLERSFFWPETSLREVLSIMVKDYEEGSFVEPWGGIPYIVIYPVRPGEKIDKIGVGLQIQQYGAALSRWNTTESPWGDLEAVRNGVKRALSGPIAVKVI